MDATAATKSITNRRELINGLSRFAQSSTPIGLSLFLLDFLQYMAAVAGVLLLPPLWMKVVAGLLAGFKLSNLVVLAHDAAHNTLTADKRLNWLLAVLSLMPGFFNYRLWCWDHHLLHHPWPNGDHPDAFKPLSKAQFDAMPGHRQLIHRLYRNSWGLGFGVYYTLERWLKVKLWPREGVPAKLRASAWKHFAFLLVYGGAFVALLAAAPLYSDTTSVTAVMLGFVLPQFVYMTIVAAVLFLQHSHPDLPWLASNDLGDVYAVPEYLSTQYRVPHWASVLTHAVFDHSVHHAHPRIPCYRVEEAQAWLNAWSAGPLVSEPLSLVRLHQLLRQCKLYDYEGRRWLDFDGMPTTPAVILHRASGHAAMQEAAPSVT